MFITVLSLCADVNQSRQTLVGIIIFYPSALKGWFGYWCHPAGWEGSQAVSVDTQLREHDNSQKEAKKHFQIDVIGASTINLR